MQYEYMKYPTTVLALANELKRVVSDYNSRKIGNDELKEIVLWYAAKCPDKLFTGHDFNITVQRILGQRRLNAVNMALDGFQFTFFKGVR